MRRNSVCPTYESVNSLVQHQEPDDDQYRRDERGVLAFHPVLEPRERFVEAVSRYRVGEYWDRHGRGGDNDVKNFGDPYVGLTEPFGADRQTRCRADE